MMKLLRTVQADTAGGTGHMGAETKYLVASSNFSDSVNIQDNDIDGKAIITILESGQFYEGKDAEFTFRSNMQPGSE